MPSTLLHFQQCKLVILGNLAATQQPRQLEATDPRLEACRKLARTHVRQLQLGLLGLRGVVAGVGADEQVNEALDELGMRQVLVYQRRDLGKRRNGLACLEGSLELANIMRFKQPFQHLELCEDEFEISAELCAVQTRVERGRVPARQSRFGHAREFKSRKQAMSPQRESSGYVFSAARAAFTTSSASSPSAVKCPILRPLRASSLP